MSDELDQRFAAQQQWINDRLAQTVEKFTEQLKEQNRLYSEAIEQDKAARDRKVTRDERGEERAERHVKAWESIAMALNWIA